MKLQVFLAFSVLAAVTSQASAQTAETRLAAATPAVTAVEPAAARKPQLPPATAAVEPDSVAQARQKPRRVRRPVARQQEQPTTWQERMRAMWGVNNPQADPRQDVVALIHEQGLEQVSDQGELTRLIGGILAANPEQVAQFRAGKEKVFGFFVGQVMKQTGGKANPAAVNELLRAALLRN